MTGFPHCRALVPDDSNLHRKFPCCWGCRSDKPRRSRRVAKTSDFDVIQWILGGEIAPFEVLLRQHQQDTYRLTFRMTRNAEDAKDLAQVTFVQSYRALGTFRGQSRFSTWLDR